MSQQLLPTVNNNSSSSGKKLSAFATKIKKKIKAICIYTPKSHVRVMPSVTSSRLWDDCNGRPTFNDRSHERLLSTVRAVFYLYLNCSLRFRLQKQPTHAHSAHTHSLQFSVIKCCLIISIDNANRDLSSTPVVPIRNDAQMRLPPFMDASIHPFGQRIVHKVGRRCVVFGFFLCFFGQNNIRPHQPLTDLGRHTRQAAALALMIHRSAFVRSVRYMSSLV